MLQLFQALILGFFFTACGSGVSIGRFEALESKMHEVEMDYLALQADHNLHHLVELLYFSSEAHGLQGIYEYRGGMRLRLLPNLGTTKDPNIVITITVQVWRSDCTYVMDVWRATDTGFRWLNDERITAGTPPCNPDVDLMELSLKTLEPVSVSPF